MRSHLVLVFATVLGAPAADLPAGLTLHADFNGSVDARVAKGDRRIHSAPSYRQQAAARPGLAGTGVELVSDGGRNGSGALRFPRKNTQAVFYPAGGGNVAFDPANWTGTLSFWLRLDPDSDLEPGYCDPVQVTDKDYNDSAIWVDFTKDEKPRHFRLGIFGALKSWNPRGLPPDQNPAFLKRLVVVTRPPFSRNQWTHVAVVYEGLGSVRGKATLYLNGQSQGTSEGIAEPFAWDPNRAAVRLGVNYVGWMDDVMVFDRALTALEIAALGR